ncbi:MAG: ABC transporter substrate-binding protein [Pseudonocardiales bacterium]|nr:ABC transporter substrate-binding protein [Pseudonocardiales bacterium]
MMVGAPPDIDGFVIAVGDANLIVNGVPSVFSAAHFGWKILEPRLVDLPNVESNIESPVNSEELLALNPDVVLTNDPSMAEQVQRLGVPTVCITKEDPGTEQERDAATMVGEILGKQKEAAAYMSYFTNIVNLVRSRTQGIPASQRPSALYLATMPFRRNGPAMEWYLRFIGATDVAGTIPPVSQFSTEQILQWDPDYIIAHDPLDEPVINHDPVLKNVKAVQEGHVVHIPQDLNEWGDFGAPDALGLLWTAKYLYPQQFSDIDMDTMTKNFLSRFYGVNLSKAQLDEILNGIGGSTVNYGS